MQTAQMLKAKREERAAALDKVKALSAKIENRTWKEDVDGPALDAAKTELESLETEVRRLEGIMDIEARSASWTSSTTTENPVTVNVISSRGDNVNTVKKQYRFAEAVQALRSGKMEGFVKEMHEEALREAAHCGIRDYGAGIMIPAFVQQQRDMTAGTTTEGGYTVQTDVGELIPFLDPQGVLSRLGVDFMSGLVGNIDFPRNDGTATAVWAGEQTTSTETSPTFDRVQFAPNRLTAYTEISSQIMRQSQIMIENMVRNRLMRARDNALDVAALTGAGGTAPTGITGTSGVNVITVAASPTWAKIVDFETQIAADDAAFGTSLAYLTTPQVAGILKGAKRDVAGNGFIWEGNNTGTGSINGYRALTSTLVPTGSGGHYMFFGNWNQLKVGQWGGTELLLNPYTRLKDATIELVLNTWHDIAVAHGQAFSYSATVHPS
ncbi:MAG: phage major capsid protein [Chitinophagaceae bacterium]|nr:phage major capsid protein [Chitinophagaceae bacterium]